MFDVFTPHPLHDAPDAGLPNAAGGAGHIACADGVVLKASANLVPVTNSAIARRSPADRPVAIEIIRPVSIAASTRVGDIARNASRSGARAAAASWQEAQ